MATATNPQPDRTITKYDNYGLAKIKPYEFNAKIHTDEQISHIAKSIELFGWQQPIVIDENDIILIGHGRFEAAKKLSLTQVPVWVNTGLTDSEKNALRLADNKINSETGFDEEALRLSLEQITDMPMFELGLTFNINELFKPEATEDDFDEKPAIEQECFIKTGDLIELGQHRILCDSFDKAIGIDKVDFLFADPPYGINENCDRAFASITRLASGGKFEQIIGDENTDAARNAIYFFRAVPIQVWFGANHYAHAFEESPTWLVWDKRCEDKERDFNSDAELAYVKHHTKSVRIFRHKWKGLIKDSEHGIARIHPTQKPMALIAFCISEYASDARLIYDPFLGSGSTLIACEQLGITCRGTEIYPQYCQAIIERYRKHCATASKPCVCKVNGESI